MNADLEKRSDNKCELCQNSSDIKAYTLPPQQEEIADNQIAICAKCQKLIDTDLHSDTDHWRCLNESMWSDVSPVKVMTHRILSAIETEPWAMDLKNQMYLDETEMEWAQFQDGTNIIHLDANGNQLIAGDSVTLIQDLNVKGANFTAKRGTAVRRIRLVHDNPEHIEGKIDGQQIVILTKYVKKQ